MSKSTTREYTLKIRERYGAMKTKVAKGRVLDDFCATTGLGRKHAIKVLRSNVEPLRAAGRKAEYAGASDALRAIWLFFDQPCSKLLHPVLGSYVASYERRADALDAETKALLLKMSPSTIDRLLRPHRVRTSRWRGHGSPMANMKRHVPVRSERWDGRGPGWVEADSVAHCGGSMAGSFAYTLTLTDTDTQWTELRAVWNRGGHATTLRVQEIEQMLPFPLKGVNTDNGSEFLNGHFVRHFNKRDVEVLQTRSRPYHKNDNARVEQKNGSHVRSLLGYDRFDDPACVDDLNEILVLHSCWTNLFRRCMKLISKTKEGHRYKKIYDKPMTPAQRLLATPGLSRDVKTRMVEMMKTYDDCYALKCQVQTKTRQFFERYVLMPETVPSCPGAGSSPSALRGQGTNPPRDSAVPIAAEPSPASEPLLASQTPRCHHYDATANKTNHRYGVTSI